MTPICASALPKGDASSVLEAFKALTVSSNNREANYLASKTISLLAKYGQWSLCKCVGSGASTFELDFEPDTRAFTSVRALASWSLVPTLIFPTLRDC